MATKRTADLIPLCHPLVLTRVVVEFSVDASASSVSCAAEVETFGKTCVEIEALISVQVGLLTVYDMCKALDQGIVINALRVLEKHGRRSAGIGWHSGPPPSAMPCTNKACSKAQHHQN